MLKRLSRMLLALWAEQFMAELAAEAAANGVDLTPVPTYNA
jgi:hypothetical protein